MKSNDKPELKENETMIVEMTAANIKKGAQVEFPIGSGGFKKVTNVQKWKKKLAWVGFDLDGDPVRHVLWHGKKIKVAILTPSVRMWRPLQDAEGEE